jgi:hypothetical protein
MISVIPTDFLWLTAAFIVLIAGFLAAAEE